MLLTSIDKEAYQVSSILGKILTRFCQVALAETIFISGVIGASSCSSEFVKSLQDTAQVISTEVRKTTSFQSILSVKYGKGVGSTFGRSHSKDGVVTTVKVQFTNTKFNELAASEREKVARDIAELAKDHFALVDPEDSISVEFVDFRNYGVVKLSTVVDTYTLNPQDLESISPTEKNFFTGQDIGG